jgi:hypothetical protein
MAMPPTTKMEPSRPCARCAEATNPSKMEFVNGQKVTEGAWRNKPLSKDGIVDS